MHEVYPQALTSTRFAPGTKGAKYHLPVRAPVTTRSVDIPLPAAVSRLPECSFCGQSSPSIYSRALWPGLLLEIQTVIDCTLRRPTALFPPPVPGHNQNLCL